ncbi:MAG: cation:proton antiporter [Dehalococcoidia bacterium]|nr:cation:proton antiporter [Dehalococcoidia bacterium]
MGDLEISVVMGLMILAASMLSVELGISVAIIEILMGVLGGNLLGLHITPWVDFLAAFGSIVLTFLAGAEVDPDLLREKWKESLLIGGFSFLLPFLGALFFAFFVAGWSFPASEITGIALSTTSLAVVYAVLVETGLTSSQTGKIIMAACFITDLGVALALSILFMQPTWWLLPFVIGSALLIFLLPRLHPWFFARYGNRVIEPEIKGAFFALFILMFLGEMAQSHAVLPAFLLGLAVARVFAKHRSEQQRFRVVAFAVLTPFFFIKAGMNVSLGALWSNLGLMVLFLVVKLMTKMAGVLPFARRYVAADSWFTTLLMSTGLTFGTISSFYGLRAGIINEGQFSILITVVILSAVAPTFVAQRFFNPLVRGKGGAGLGSVATAGTARQEGRKEE